MISQRQQVDSVPRKERVVPGKDLAGTRVSQEDMLTEQEIGLVHKRPVLKRSQ